MKKIFTYIKRIVKYVLRAVLERLRKDISDRKDAGG